MSNPPKRAMGTISPFDDPDVTARLDAWATALEAAVGTLNRTLTEVKEYKAKHLKGGDDDAVAGAADVNGGADDQRE